MQEDLLDDIEEIVEGWYDVAGTYYSMLAMGEIVSNPIWEKMRTDSLKKSITVLKSLNDQSMELKSLYTDLIENIKLMKLLNEELIKLTSMFFDVSIPLTVTQIKSLAKKAQANINSKLSNPKHRDHKNKNKHLIFYLKDQGFFDKVERATAGLLEIKNKFEMYL